MSAKDLLVSALLALLSCVAVLSAGEESRHEEVVKQTLATLDKISTTLATIRDRETADAARPDLKKSAALYTKTLATADGLPPPDRAEKDRLAKTYRGRMTEAVRKLHGESLRIENIPGGRAALQDIRSVLERSVTK